MTTANGVAERLRQDEMRVANRLAGECAAASPAASAELHVEPLEVARRESLERDVADVRVDPRPDGPTIALEHRWGDPARRLPFAASLGAISEDIALRGWIERFPSPKTYRPVSIPIGEDRADAVLASLAAALGEIVRPPRETFLRDRDNAELEVAEA